MNFSPDQILGAIVTYLGVLFLVGYLGDRGLLPTASSRNPLTYVLSLGVIGGGLASNGVFDLAAHYGQQYLLYYVGIAMMFVLGVLLLRPLLRLCRVHQLASLADVLTFRFHSPRVGAAVTLAMCLTMLPLLALQIRTVSDNIRYLAGPGTPLVPGIDQQHGLALLFCFIITVFTILFGTRNAASPNRNPGLVAAIAFESLVKLAALTLLMLVSVYQVFGGFGELQQWLITHRDLLNPDPRPLEGGAARTLLLLFFAGAVCMPHIFHMTFAENSESGHLRAASWGMPLYLLLLSLPVLPILWGATSVDSSLPPAYAGLALGAALGSEWISAVAFIAGLSAASAVIMVGTLALANMCLNYLILPSRLQHGASEQDLYQRLRWLRRVLIALLILGGYGFYSVIGASQTLPELGYLAFSGTLHFFPAVIFTPYWSRANRVGFLAGLAAGLSLWAVTLLLPVLSDNTLGFALPGGDAWAMRCMLALAGNVAVFITLSLLTNRSDEEIVAAEICSMDSRSRLYRRNLSLNGADEFAGHLARALGDDTARAEVERALKELRFNSSESRPYALRHLRARIEANLSGMLGPALALEIVDSCLPYAPALNTGADDFMSLEYELENTSGRFTGVAADLDYLRRHYRQTLDELPVGLCSLGVDGEILLWNRSIRQITGVSAAAAVGSRWTDLPRPWRESIADALDAPADTLLRREVSLDDSTSRSVSLFCSAPSDHADRLVLVRDITDYQNLQEEVLHNERLASIGRLAAGVAHEIGNPMTGIACLAQNLADSSDPDDVREAADGILKQAARVNRIVESLINFSHMGSNLGNNRLAACNLADCVDEATELLQLGRDENNVRFSNRCRRDTLVFADSQQLMQVFINLLSNARDASPDNAVVVVSDCDSDSGDIQVFVDDTGHGIPTRTQGRVFEPFFTTKDVGQGTGLGLALVYSILENIDGSVRIDSPGPVPEARGTRVALTLRPGHYDADFTMVKDSA